MSEPEPPTPEPIFVTTRYTLAEWMQDEPAQKALEKFLQSEAGKRMIEVLEDWSLPRIEIKAETSDQFLLLNAHQNIETVARIRFINMIQKMRFSHIGHVKAKKAAQEKVSAQPRRKAQRLPEGA